MKIDRVIFCLNDNPIYTGFWNPFSRVWKQKFDILPTLMFVGTPEELKKNELSERWGDVIRLDPVPEVILDPSLDWSVTWALFYGASLFNNEVCLTMGIDQLSLSNTFFDFLRESEEIDNDKYVVALAGAYLDLPNIYPSSWHCAKGSTYKSIYGIDSDWETEVKKVFSCKNKYPRLPQNLWALDEAYSSDILHHTDQQEKIILFDIFHKYWKSRRLDRGGNLLYNKEMLRSGEYIEIHAPKPFEKHKEYLSQLLEDLLQNE